MPCSFLILWTTPVSGTLSGNLNKKRTGESVLENQDHFRVVIADDHPLMRGALRQAVSGLGGTIEIVEAGSLDEASTALGDSKETDILLLDLTMPGCKGFSGLLYMRAQHPGVPVMVVSAHDEPDVIRSCIEFGAAGFIPKTLEIEGMREAIRVVLGGGTWAPKTAAPPRRGAAADPMVVRLASLTPQQVRVLTMLSDGLLNKQIAYELDVSEATVKAHVSAILTKLGVESRTQAVIAASKFELGHWGAAPQA